MTTTTFPARSIPTTNTHRAPRIDRAGLVGALCSPGAWIALIGATGYITSTLVGPGTSWIYALAYGPAFVLCALLMFLWRYQDVVEDKGGRAPIRRLVAGLTVVAIAMVPIGLTAGLSVAQTRAAAPATFANAAGFAPGYSWDVVAAGYMACGELARGATPEEVAAGLRENGLNGDLHTDLEAARIVEHAHTLCPNV